MQLRKRTSFNDGVAYVYREKLKVNDFNAKINSKKADDFELIRVLFYSLETKRQQDFMFAESLSKQLTLKIKTPLAFDVESNYKIVIDNYIYDIIHLDPDNANKELYIYLEGVREYKK